MNTEDIRTNYLPGVFRGIPLDLRSPGQVVISRIQQIRLLKNFTLILAKFMGPKFGMPVKLLSTKMQRFFDLFFFLLVGRFLKVDTSYLQAKMAHDLPVFLSFFFFLLGNSKNHNIYIN